MKQVLSFFVISIYIALCAFIGSMFFGSGGLKIFLLLSLALIWITFFLGDKLILFLIGARELTLKNLKLESFLGGLSCEYEIPPLKLYRISLSQSAICLLKSAGSTYALIMTDDLIEDNNEHSKFIQEVIGQMDYERDTLVDLAIALCYQILLPGYLLSYLSPMAKSVYFYLLYPIVVMKSYLSSSQTGLDREAVFPERFYRRDTKKISPLIGDIFFDYGIIFSGRGNLWGNFLH